MIDAYIAAMGQFSVSAAVQLQRRTLEYAMTNGYNFDGAHGKVWSENHMVTVLAGAAFHSFIQRGVYCSHRNIRCKHMQSPEYGLAVMLVSVTIGGSPCFISFSGGLLPCPSSTWLAPGC